MKLTRHILTEKIVLISNYNHPSEIPDWKWSILYTGLKAQDMDYYNQKAYEYIAREIIAPLYKIKHYEINARHPYAVYVILNKTHTHEFTKNMIGAIVHDSRYSFLDLKSHICVLWNNGN